MIEQIDSLGRSSALVHFEYDGKVACMPNMREFHGTFYHPPIHRTNDVRAVRCQGCEKSEAFAAAKRELDKLRVK